MCAREALAGGVEATTEELEEIEAGQQVTALANLPPRYCHLDMAT